VAELQSGPVLGGKCIGRGGGEETLGLTVLGGKEDGEGTAEGGYGGLGGPEGSEGNNRLSGGNRCPVGSVRSLQDEVIKLQINIVAGRGGGGGGGGAY
jgi:hypothetical protein